MSSIGGFSFLKMDGEVLSGLVAQIAIISRVSTDSIGSEETASKPPETRVRTYEGYTLLADANAARAEYEALAGTYVTVVNDMGLTTYNVLVQNVTGVKVQQVISATDSSVNYIVSAEWVLYATE